MRKEFSNTFRFHTIEDFEKTEWIPMEKTEDAFLEVKTKQLHFDNTKIFNLGDVQNYQTICCNYQGFSSLIIPSKNFIKEDEKFYISKIW